MLKLDPKVERDQAVADALQLVKETRALAEAAIEEARRDEREACIAALEGLDRTGREWVPGSVWSNIFRAGIEAIRARGQDPLPEWRCVGCKAVFSAACEPHDCTECGGASFALVDQRDVLPRYVQRRRAAGKGPGE